MTTSQSWRDYRLAVAGWPLAHFTVEEMATAGSPAKRDTLLTVHWPSATALDRLRSALGHPLIVNSAYRSPDHNARVGGVPNSQHLQGRAFDIDRGCIRDERRFLVEAWRLGFKGFGFYDSFIHIDTGAMRMWDERSDQSEPPIPPWDLPGADRGIEVPVDIRAVPMPPRKPDTARPSTQVAGGVAGAGVVIAAVSEAESARSLLESLGWGATAAGIGVALLAVWLIWRRVRRDRREGA